MTTTALPRLALSLLALLPACAGSAAPDYPTASADPDQLHERIVSVLRADDGSASVTFEYSQRRFTIDPTHSPDAASMIQFAEANKASGNPVFATVAPSGVRTKGDDGPPFVLVRLTAEPAAKR